MRVEIIANRLSETDQGTGQLYRAGKGDVFTVSDAFGQHLCDEGWAKDVEGQYPSAPFTPGAKKLTVRNVTVTAGQKGA